MSKNEHIYRVGVIGTGRIASTIQDEFARKPSFILYPHSHAGAYDSLPMTNIVAAADTNSERLSDFARRWSVPSVYRDYREMLKNEQLDIVSICTPTSSHRQIALDVAARGVKAVFLEKPVAQSLRDVDLIAAAFDENAVKVAINHTRTYDPYYRRVRELIAEGLIGDLHTFMVHWHEGFLFGGTHLFDLLRYLSESEVEWVFGQLMREKSAFDPGGTGMLRFQNGVDALINIRVGHAAPIEIDIVGSKGRIRIGGALFPELYTKDQTTGEMVQRGFPAAVWGISAMTIAVKELVRAIETGVKPASDLKDGRAAVEIAVAFHLSDMRNAPVHLPVTDLDVIIEDPWGRS